MTKKKISTAKYEVYSEIDFTGVDETGLVSIHRTLRAAIKRVKQLIKDVELYNDKLTLKHFGIYKEDKLVWSKKSKKRKK